MAGWGLAGSDAWRRQIPTQRCFVAVLLICVLQQTYAAVEIAPSIHLHYMSQVDVKLDADGTLRSTCITEVGRAAAYNSSWINFFPVQYWYDALGGFQIDYFCYKNSPKDDVCRPYTVAAIQRWQQGFQACVTAAAALGLHVSYTGHLDDHFASSFSRWRNLLLLNPIEKHAGEQVQQPQPVQGA